MKRTATVLSMLLTPWILQAQPTFNTGDLSFLPGQYFETLYVGPYEQPATGAGLTWNYTGLTDLQSGGTYNFVDPATTPGGSLFPQATAADQPLPGAIYYASYPDAETFLGYHTPMSSQMVCSDERIRMMYPFTYGSTFTDNFVCTETGATNRIRTGTTTVTAVGYGTLLLPYGSFEDVLLIQTLQNYEDEYPMPPNAVVTSEAYSFYQAGIPVELLIFSTNTNVQGGETVVSQGAILLNMMTTSIAEVTRPHITVFPNPSNGEFMVEIPENWAGKMSIIASDGRLIYEEQLVNSKMISGRNLSEGLYIVRFEDQAGNIESFSSLMIKY